MRENYRKSIASIERLPQFTTMNVIDGQAGIIICSSLIFYSLTIDNILNIIVLLILAAVSIATLTGQNGILTQANNAKDNTRGASVQEAIDLWNANKKSDELAGTSTAQSKTALLDDLVSQKLLTESERNKLETGETITIGNKEITLAGDSTLADEVEVGDYIKYGETLPGYVNGTYTTTMTQTGDEKRRQTFHTNYTMLWRVINKKANGEVEIVAVNNVLADDGQTGLYLKGQTGFLNAETVLNELCESLYTIQDYGTARSIKVEDINNLTGFDPETSDWDEKDYYLNNRTQTYTSGGPFWDKSTNTFRTATTENPITVEHTAYWYTVNESMQLYDTLIAESKTYSGDYSETNYPLFYWLGSRSVHANVDSAGFYVRAVGSGDVGGWGLFYAATAVSADEYENACGVRPIVTLKSKVQIDKSDTSKDGSTPEKAIELVISPN